MDSCHRRVGSSHHSVPPRSPAALSLVRQGELDLAGHRRRQPGAAGACLHRLDALDRPVGEPVGADAALADEGGQALQDVADRPRGVVPVQPVEVDVPHAEALEALGEVLLQVRAGEAALVHLAQRRVAALGGDQDALPRAAAAQPFADGQLAGARPVGRPGAVDVGGVQEVASRGQVGVHHGECRLARHARAVAGRAEADAGRLDLRRGPPFRPASSRPLVAPQVGSGEGVRSVLRQQRNAPPRRRSPAESASPSAPPGCPARGRPGASMMPITPTAATPARALVAVADGEDRGREQHGRRRASGGRPQPQHQVTPEDGLLGERHHGHQDRRQRELRRPVRDEERRRAARAASARPPRTPAPDIAAIHQKGTNSRQPSAASRPTWLPAPADARPRRSPLRHRK